MDNKVKEFELPPLTKEEAMKRIEFMIENCSKKDVVVSLKNALSYVKRIRV